MQDITEREVESLVDRLGSDTMRSNLKQVMFPETRQDVCGFARAIESRDLDPPAYAAMDGIYIAWRGPSDTLQRALLAASSDRDDFLDVLTVREDGPDIVVEYDSGDYGGRRDVIERRIPKSELGLS